MRSTRFADAAVFHDADRLRLLQGARRSGGEHPEAGTWCILAEDGGGKFDAVIIETSGLSEVGPVAQTFFADKFVQRNFRLDAVLALVDARSAAAAGSSRRTGRLRGGG